MTFMPDISQIKPRVPKKKPPSKGQIVLGGEAADGFARGGGMKGIHGNENKNIC